MTPGTFGATVAIYEARPHIELRRDLLRYLAATSEERARRLIGELTQRNPGMVDLLLNLEADDGLRNRFEIELLRSVESNA